MHVVRCEKHFLDRADEVTDRNLLSERGSRRIAFESGSLYVIIPVYVRLASIVLADVASSLRFCGSTAARSKETGKRSVLDNVYSAARFPQLSTSHLRFPSTTL